MVDLVQWLRAQLDEDERIARAVEDRSAPWDGQWMADGNSAVRTFNGHVLFYRHDERPLKPGLADHVAEHDPARVLREIDAKRKILAECSYWYDRVNASATEKHPQPDLGARFEVAMPILLLLALPYSDRPGYREEWAP